MSPTDFTHHLAISPTEFTHHPVVQFAERLISKMPGLSRVYYSSSGSEANEKAFKMVRQISQFKYGGKKKKILYRERDYHGTTISTLSASGQEERKEVSPPLQHARLARQPAWAARCLDCPLL